MKMIVVANLIFLLFFGSSCHRKTAPESLSKLPSITMGTLVQEEGIASFYDDKLIGKPTASGDKYDPTQLTAAHRKLPFGTTVKVTNLANRRTVTVFINDRGPHKRGRIIDVSRAAAKALGMEKQGVAEVIIQYIQ